MSVIQDFPAYQTIEFADKGPCFGDGQELGRAHPTVRFSVIADRFGLDRCDQPDPIFFQRFGIWVLKLLAKVGHFDVAYPIPKHHIAVLDKFTELLGALVELVIARVVDAVVVNQDTQLIFGCVIEPRNPLAGQFDAARGNQQRYFL
jgi:hypothetical protein